MLSLDALDQRWSKLTKISWHDTGRKGEYLVIRGNGLGYYAWLRSLLIDHDWRFDNEFDDHRFPGDYVPPPTYRTELDRRANQWSVGPACVWALAVVPAHYALKSLAELSPWAADGYSLPYQLAVGVTSVLVSYAGLCLLYGICRQFARPNRAALAAILLTLGSSLIYYDAIEVSMAHGMASAFLAGCIYYWLRTFGSDRLSRWFIVGLLLGAAALMRWQMATFAILPAGEAALSWWSKKTKKKLAELSAGLLMTALGALITFSPQMIAWKCVYGHWLVEPVPQIAHHWLSPSLWQVLVSYDRGLFYWTPICALAFLGYFISRPTREEPAVILIAAFTLQAYALASLWGKGPYLQEVGNFAGAFPSKSFGMRHLTEATIVLAPGFAMLIDSGKWRFRLATGLGTVLALANLVLVYLYCSDKLPIDAGAEPAQLVDFLRQFILAEPTIFFIFVEAIGLIVLFLTWGAAAEEPLGKAELISNHRLLAGVRWGLLALLILGTLASQFSEMRNHEFQFREFRDSAGKEHK
jgi:hypothetical protein